MSAQRSRRRVAADVLSRAAMDDTIAAIATPVGRGAVAMIRVSGPRALAVAAACITPWPLAERHATLVTVRAPDSGDVEDQAVAAVFMGPRSFTGEDTVEITSHGGTVAPARVLAALVRAGARPAYAGEFTRRAVLNGKLDLLQAEALGDLIDAPTSVVHRAALEQLGGALTRRIASLRDAMIELEALLAYDVDFPEEDDGPIARSRITNAARETQNAIANLLATLPAARLAREGAVVVLAGVPNAGKSSLFNAMLGEARAIVTEHAGTTRDAIDALLEADPYPLRVVDTAGLRDAHDPIERLGVEVSTRWLARADVVLVCGPTRAARDATAAAVASAVGGTPAHAAPEMVRVQTMSDLAEDRAPAASETAPGGDAATAVSALTGEGLDALRKAIGSALAHRYPAPPANTPLILRARHESALSTASQEMASFVDAWNAGAVPATVAAIHVRAAVHALDVLIGAVDLDDVLGRLFERFCVGK